MGDWECDVDQWYWSCDEAYLIDQQGHSFKQLAERDDAGRPIDIPVWLYDDAKTLDFVRGLVVAQYKRKPSFADYTIEDLIDYIHQTENH